MENASLKINDILNIESKFLSLMKDVVLIVSFAFLTGVAAKLSIVMGVVPITMQTLVVLLSGLILGSKKGALSQLTYLLTGIFGIPLFALGGGMAYVMSPTFGYLLGFILAAFTVGYLCEKGFSKRITILFIALFIGNIFLYIPSLIWLAGFVGFKNVLIVGLYPFLFGDLLKIGLVGLLFLSGRNMIIFLRSKKILI